MTLYLATPYSAYPGPRNVAWQAACRALRIAQERWGDVFSPIASWHMVDLDGHPRGKTYWDRGWSEGVTESQAPWYDKCLAKMDECSGLIVAKLPGWHESKGIAMEIEYFGGVTHWIEEAELQTTNPTAPEAPEDRPRGASPPDLSQRAGLECRYGQSRTSLIFSRESLRRARGPN